MSIRYYSKGKSYSGKTFECPYCHVSKIIRKNRNFSSCKSCCYGKRKSDIKDNDTFIEIQTTTGRKYRTKAMESKCSKCGKNYLRKKNQYKTKICKDCICQHNGRLSFKNGNSIYRKHSLADGKVSCAFCGDHKNLHIHHIDLNRENNSSQNLMPLCHSCHLTVHWQIRKGLSPLDALQAVKSKKTEDKYT